MLEKIILAGLLIGMPMQANQEGNLRNYNISSQEIDRQRISGRSPLYARHSHLAFDDWISNCMFKHSTLKFNHRNLYNFHGNFT